MKTALIPPPLSAGDVLGIIAPAGQLQKKGDFIQGIKILQEMGFALKFPRDLWPGYGYLADTDEMRSLEFNDLLRDSEVKGLISLRGGYGCLRMLEGIDLDLVRAHPKYFIGFSDITILQNYLFETTGLVSLHGPVVTSLATQELDSLLRFIECLHGRWHSELRSSEIEVLIDGSPATGHLVGGNLASLLTMLGTRYDMDWAGAIVLLEDINEPSYKVDRMLTQLALAGKFANIRGLILGNFSSSAQATKLEQLQYQEEVWRRVMDLLGPRQIPIWGNFPSGHCRRNLTLPIGAQTTMDSSRNTLYFR